MIIPGIFAPKDDIDDTLGLYKVEADLDEITPDMLTDTGLRVDELEEIGTCVITPGHPAPIGRAPTGELAHVVLPHEDYLCLDRGDAAALAHLLHKTCPGAAVDTHHPAHGLLRSLTAAAVPQVLFPNTDSAHGALAYHTARTAALTTGTSPFSPRAIWLDTPQSDPSTAG